MHAGDASMPSCCALTSLPIPYNVMHALNTHAEHSLAILEIVGGEPTFVNCPLNFYMNRLNWLYIIYSVCGGGGGGKTYIHNYI